MPDIVEKALRAKRESKYIEFKQDFDSASARDWCEVIKDIVAIANSGGGVIVFGLDNLGSPTGRIVDSIRDIDPADVSNVVTKYTGPVDLEFEIRELQKNGHRLYAFVIQGVAIPIVFQRPGTYDAGSGKQKAAFGIGTVYFRHGAKSEPGRTEDIRIAIERQLESIRKSWIKGVRKVVQAPQGSQLVTIQATGRVGAPPISTTVRAVNDPNAIPVHLTRDTSKATGAFVHEEVSEGIFDEINNVIDANRVLARGQKRFFLGLPIYYRIYAERHHVLQTDENTALLFHSAITDLYAPGVFWATTLPENIVASTLSDLYLRPRSPAVHCLMRMAILLGKDFSEWLHRQWRRKWGRRTQPPPFYWTFDEMHSAMGEVDPRTLSARVSLTSKFNVRGEAASVRQLLDTPQSASSLLSKACMGVFEGNGDMRSVARTLDYLAYGLQLRDRATKISGAILEIVGDQLPSESVETVAVEE